MILFNDACFYGLHECEQQITSISFGWKYLGRLLKSVHQFIVCERTTGVFFLLFQIAL